MISFETFFARYEIEMQDYLKSPEWLNRRRSSKVVAEEARERGRRALEGVEEDGA